jgi:hypothetical protein
MELLWLDAEFPPENRCTILRLRSVQKNFFSRGGLPVFFTPHELISRQGGEQKHQGGNPESHPDKKTFNFGYVAIHWPLLENLPVPQLT